MASDKPNSPSWKNAGGSRGSKSSRKAWQPGGKAEETAPADPKARFRRRAIGAGLTGSLLIALFVYVFLFVGCYKPPPLVLIAPETNATLSAAANVYGSNSAGDLVKWAAEGKDKKDRPQLASDAPMAGRDDWRKALAKLGDDPKESIVLYFAAHGAADGKNGPYLWMSPSDATSVDDAFKLPVTDILAELRTKPNAHKLVIFDSAQVPASWAHGFLHNDFARALKTLDSKIEDVPNLVLICSSGEDQRSWASEEWQRTIFGHFLIEGLNGGAGQQDPRIKVSQLFEYVEKEVSHWVLANRDAEQSPILLPSKSGKQRAAELELVSVDPGQYHAMTPESAPGNQFNPSELKAAWGTALELSQRMPPPETAAPQVWRAYLDTLLRWEFLVRAGADTKAVSRDADALAKNLEKGLFLSEPQFLANSLAIPSALGSNLPDLDNARFLEVWNDPPTGKNRGEIWRELQRARSNEGSATLLRLQVAQKVFDRIRKDPTSDVLAHARRVLDVVDEGQLRPIETHYALMLQRDLSDDRPDAKRSASEQQRPDPDLIKRALDLRAEAERIAWMAGGANGGYSYAEQSFRWIETSLREADRERRLGEDLLFASDKDSFDKARKHFETAAGKYDRCAADAQMASRGLLARDRVLARLPYYARWLAAYRTPPAGGLSPAEQKTLLELVETLASNAHQIAEKLEVTTSNPAARLAEIKVLTESLQTDLAKLERDFEQDTARLTSVVLPSNWHAIDNALSVPFLVGDRPIERRTKLLTDLRTISRQLNEGKSGNATAAASPFNAKEAAQRQGRMALAILGERWVDDVDARNRAPRGMNPLHFRELQKRVTEPSAGGWWESLREAGDQIGWHFREMVPSINADLGDAIEADLKAIPKAVARAGLLARLLDSATSIGAKMPTVDERRYWTHEMLLWQSRRTAEDGWAALVKGIRSYYEDAGERLAREAETLILGDFAYQQRQRELRTEKVTAGRALLKLPIPPEYQRAEAMPLTEKRDWSVTYQISPRAGQVLGYPMIRLKGPTGPLKIAETKLRGRLPITELADGKQPTTSRTITFAFLDGAKEGDTGSTNVDLLYRGHTPDLSTTYILSDRPNVEWVYKPPQGLARFAVYGKPELCQGGVCLIIDRTLSMNDPINKGDNKTKMQELIESVKDLLKELPADTQLSIGLFHGDIKNKVHFEWLTKPILWNRGNVQADGILAALDKVTPPNTAKTTPLAQMIVDVVDENRAFPSNFVGFRNIVVLTDGDDNDAQFPAKTDRPGKKIVEALTRGDRADMALHMVLFGLDATEEANAIQQFAPIEQADLFDGSGSTPGRIWSAVRSKEKLLEALRLSMVPKVRVVRDNKRVLDLPITFIGSSNPTITKPALEPGIYSLRTSRKRWDLKLEPGDRIAIEMYRDKEIELRVPPYANVATRIPGNLRADSTDKKVHLTLTKNSLRPGNPEYDLEMVTTLELRTEGKLVELRMERPWFVWFETTPRNPAEGKPGDGKQQDFLRIENLWDRPAPAWKVKRSPWVAAANTVNVGADPALPSLTGYWVNDFQGEHGRVTIDRLNNLTEEMRKYNKATAIGPVNIKNVDIRLKDKKLSVHVTGSDGKKILVHLRKTAPQVHRLQETHRWYENTNQYSVVFEPIEPEDMGRQAIFEFYYLDDLKQSAIPVQLDAEKPVKSGSAIDLLPEISEK